MERDVDSREMQTHSSNRILLNKPKYARLFWNSENKLVEAPARV
jgi:hypothetical protein